MSRADKDWTSPAARRELAALHAAATPGLTAAMHAALPALLARIERDAALLARAAQLLRDVRAHVERDVCNCGVIFEVQRTARLLADLHAAGFAPEPRPDEDGDCSRCGLSWPDERETLEQHRCPPGFTEPPRAR